MALTARRGSSFLSNIVRNIPSAEHEPKEGLVQILDIPTNLNELDFEAFVGLQLPIYDGVYFCHAFFKKQAKAELKRFLQTSYPPIIDHAPWRFRPKEKTFTKSLDFSTACPDEMDEDYVMFCNITVEDKYRAKKLFDQGCIKLNAL